MTFVFVVICNNLLDDKIAHAQYTFWGSKYTEKRYSINSSTAILNGSDSGNLLDWLSIPIASENSILFLVEPKQTDIVFIDPDLAWQR